MPATIRFLAKIKTVYLTEGEPLYRYVPVPELRRVHCIMAEFRCHPRYGGLANSDLFPGVLAKIRQEITGKTGRFVLDKLPPGVTIREGFLSEVTIKLP